MGDILEGISVCSPCEMSTLVFLLIEEGITYLFKNYAKLPGSGSPPCIHFSNECPLLTFCFDASVEIAMKGCASLQKNQQSFKRGDVL
jgi:hypothetical protein